MPAPDVVSDGVAFEVERFEWTASDRLEVTGRWYGLRGHRFVRPVLVVQAGDEQRRLLAVLDHKPWAADDGEEWIAAFPWEGAPLELTSAELAVAPSLAVDLPVPLVPGRRGRAATPPEGPLPARRGVEKPAAPLVNPVARSATPAAPDSAGADEVPALRAQLASEQATVRRLTADLEDAHQGLAAAAAAADDRDALERERDAAIAARDEALARADIDHDAVIEERDLAVHERSAALYERDEALDERAAANFERSNAIAERDAALAERDRAVEAHRAAVRDLEALERGVAEAEQARSEEIANQPPVGPVRATPGAQGDSPQRPGLAWAQRIVALIVLIVWAIVVYKVLDGLV
jgi:hypothetical protein